MFLSGENRYSCQEENFIKISGSPIAYWIAEQVYSLMDGMMLGSLFESGGRFKSCNDDLTYACGGK